MRIAGLVAVATVLTVWTLRGGIVRLYSRDPGIVATALTLIPYLVAFHFFDALQAVATFVLRAYKRAIGPTVIHAAALWGVGVTGGYDRGRPDMGDDVAKAGQGHHDEADLHEAGERGEVSAETFYREHVLVIHRARRVVNTFTNGRLR